MKSDPKQCLYCTNNETLHDLMIEVAHLSCSRVFIFKEQTYHGRCLVSYDGHVDDINLLSDEQRNAFMSDVVRTTRAMQKIFNPDKSTMVRILTPCRICIFISFRNIRVVPTSAACSR